MTNKSKLLLTVGCVICAIGAILCIIGAVIGNSFNEQLFPKKTSEGKCYTYDFADSQIGVVKIEASNADVFVIGGAKKPKIEIINFNENLYTFSISNAMVTFKESADVNSALKFWQSGFTFKGLRYLLRSGNGPKKINIYVSDDTKIDNIDLSIATGNIAVEKIKSDTDFSLNVKSGNIVMSNISTSASVSINCGEESKSDINLKKVYADTLKIYAKTALFDAANIKADICDISILSGSARVDYSPKNAKRFNVNVKSVGKLIIDGCADYLDIYNYAADEENYDEENEKTAEINISGNDLAVTLDTPLEDIVPAEGSAQKESNFRDF